MSFADFWQNLAPKCLKSDTEFWKPRCSEPAESKFVKHQFGPVWPFLLAFNRNVMTVQRYLAYLATKKPKIPLNSTEFENPPSMLAAASCCFGSDFWQRFATIRPKIWLQFQQITREWTEHYFLGILATKRPKIRLCMPLSSNVPCLLLLMIRNREK